MSGPPLTVILAAGRSTRYAGPEPTKLLADVGGRPCVCRVVDALEAGLGEQEQIVVTGWQAEAVEAAIGPAPHRRYVRQGELRGTGHALSAALATVPGNYPSSYVVVAAGDKPLLSAETVRKLWYWPPPNRWRPPVTVRPSVAFLAADLPHPAGSQGRVMLGSPDCRAGHVPRIVEVGAAGGYPDPDAILACRRVNCSLYAWHQTALRRAMAGLPDGTIPDWVNASPEPVPIYLPGDRWYESLGVDTAEQLEEVRSWLPAATG